MDQAPETTQSIPIPPDFPVEWDDPAQEQLFWMQDRMHFPRPTATMMGSLHSSVLGPALAAAAEQSGAPVVLRFRVINGYTYAAAEPVALPPGEAERREEQAQEQMAQVLGSLAQTWDEQFLPAIKGHLAFLESFDLATASHEALRAHLDEAVDRLKAIWTIHFLVVFPVHLAMSMFDDFYRDLFGQDDTFGAFRLLQGFDNKTLEADRALWRLSRGALAIPEVSAVLEEKMATEAMPSLEEIQEAAGFMADLRAFLDEFGRRGADYDDIAEPSWIEDPTPAIMRLKEFMRQPDRDLDAELAGQAAAREAALAEVRDRLRDYPEAVVGQFEFLLKAAQESTVLTEVHNYWIDFRSVHAMRMIVLEFGRRLAETGVIASRDDVFFLSLDEARDSLVSPGRDLRSVVETRKAELAWAKTIQPPPALGTLPPGPPPDDPMSRSNVRFFGAAPPPSPEPGVIVGQAGSPGIARGRARIIQAAAEADRLQPGDILVTQATAPPWTPLFATIGAVVTDTGGILSHSAVVAREYGIPAVVGTGLASFSIQDGQMIEVNGSDGIVRIVDAD